MFTRHQWTVLILAAVTVLAAGALSSGWGRAPERSAEFTDSARVLAADREVEQWRAALVEFDHWGSRAHATVEPSVIDEAVSLRLVGIETTAVGREALLMIDKATREDLLPVVVVLSSGLVRVAAGDALTDRISVVAVAEESVELMIDGVSEARQLYPR